jgi:hypothetical protein
MPDMPGVPGVPAYAGPGVASRAARGSNRITCGASVKLWSVEGVAEDFGVTSDAALSLLEALGLPLLHLPGSDKKYVNLYGLESALFAMTIPGKLVGQANGGQGGEGQDLGLLRLHQELAGVMYLGATKQMVRERVKRFAQLLGRGMGGQSRTNRKRNKPLTPVVE